jgi:hypothetical protein
MQRASLLVIGLVSVLTGSRVFGECLPLIVGSFTVNGIVVGKALGGGGSPPGACTADAGWGGVRANVFEPVKGMPDTHLSRMFFVGRAAGPNLDRIYVAIHVENDDGFDANDIATLYFDANNNGTFDAPDFALRVEMGPATPPVNEACNQTANSVTFFRFSGGSWVPQALPVATAVTVKTSYDYDTAMPDPEGRIWEMEMEIRPADLGMTMPVATGLRFGAKLYIDEPGNGTRVLAFPAGLTTDDNPNATGPNDGAVTPAKLATLTVGTCGFDVQILSVDGVDHLGNSGKFTRYPNTIPSPLGESQRNKFKAQVLFTNPADSADVSAVAVPNTGTVSFGVRPWNGDFTGNFPMGTQLTDFTALGQVKSVQVSWPKNETDYSPARALLAAANHVCLKVSLSGFATNLNEPGDVMNKNLYFTTASTVKDRFLIQSPRQEGPGGVNVYKLRARWANLPDKLINKDPLKPVSGRWNYRFTNAAKIGLKDIGNGWYRIELKPNQQVWVDVEMTGGTMPVKVGQYKLSSRAGGLAATPPSGEPPLSIPVKPGMMVTVVANGLVNVSRDVKRFSANGPDGFVDREMSQREFLLNPKGAFAGWQNIGALIGSFDNFNTSFVVGGTRSFIVPDKVERLSLAINDVAGDYEDNTGKGFSLSVILTPPMFLPTRLASPGNPGNGLPVLAAPGVNLPQFHVDVLQFEERNKLLRPAGYVSYAVYNTHRR